MPDGIMNLENATKKEIGTFRKHFSLIPVYIDPEVLEVANNNIPISTLLTKIQGESNYINPVHSFIDRMENAFESFCDWLRRVCK